VFSELSNLLGEQLFLLRSAMVAERRAISPRYLKSVQNYDFLDTSMRSPDLLWMQPLHMNLSDILPRLAVHLLKLILIGIQNRFGFLGRPLQHVPSG
jgi:hypothetical protein